MRELDFIKNQRGKWSQASVPHKGWLCIGITDLKELRCVCEMCESQTVRYVHTMKHPDYPETLDAGCVCANYMEGNILEQRHAVSRQRWLFRKWKKSAKGNEYLKCKGYVITIFSNINDGWHFVVNSRGGGGFEYFSEKGYATSTEAKLASFHLFVSFSSH